jgi:hypothetical protein
MRFASWVAIIVGFVALALAIRGQIPVIDATLGVFIMFVGLNGFTSRRIAKLEATVKEMKEKAGSYTQTRPADPPRM